MTSLDHETTTPSPATPFIVSGGSVIDPQPCPTCRGWLRSDDYCDIWSDGLARHHGCRP